MISSKKKSNLEACATKALQEVQKDLLLKKDNFFFFYNKYNDSELFLMSTFFFAKKVLTANGSK
jgi:hypothetical protein